MNALYRLQGVLGLAGPHGPERLEAACAQALAVGDPGYRTVKGILLARTETDPATPARPVQAPAHLRGPDALSGPPDPAEPTTPGAHDSGEVAS